MRLTLNLFRHPTWQKWAPQGLTLLSAVLIVLSFPPWNLWPLLWIAMVPWFIVQKTCKGIQEAMIQAFWIGYLMALFAFYWVGYVLTEFGGLPWIVGVFGLLLFCTICQPHFILFAAILKKVQMGQTRLISTSSKANAGGILASLLILVVLGFTYTGIDWIIPKLFADTLGHGLYRAKYIRQAADLGGVPLLTFLIYITNSSLASLIHDWISLRKLKGKSPSLIGHCRASLTQVAFALVLCLCAWVYGCFRSQTVAKILSENQNGIQAAAIQGNIGDFDKLASERGVNGAAEKVIDTFIQLTDQAMQLRPRPDVVIWPETSFPTAFRSSNHPVEMRLDRQLEEYVQKIGVPLLFGSYDHQGNRDYNSFYYLSPNGALQTYHKNILLLFGEFIPGAETFQFIKDAFPQVGNFGRGVGPSVLNIYPTNPRVGVVPTGPIICYEALFPNYVLEAARNGSQLIMNITNDSWFGKWGEPQLHLALSTFRSIETRLPMLRTTNTGISALILPDGEIQYQTEMGVSAIMNVYVPLTAAIPTLIKKWGDWFGLFSLLAGAMGLLGLAWQSGRNVRQPH